jgi:hypothetical protein
VASIFLREKTVGELPTVLKKFYLYTKRKKREYKYRVYLQEGKRGGGRITRDHTGRRG